MNSTLFTSSVIFINNSVISVESWFIPLDILAILSTIVVIGLTIFFLYVIVFDKTCHTVSMMLVANTCLAELLLASNSLSMAIFTLQNDRKQIQYQDSLCVFRGYLSFSSCSLQNFSYLLQAIHRYIIVVHPNRPYWRSAQIQLLFISFTWIFALTYPIPLIFTDEIKYDINNQICQVPLRLSLSILYMAQCLYIIPVSLIMFVYFKLIRYVKEMSKRVTSTNALLRAQRELTMVRRIVILVMILFASGFPYSLFCFISFFTTPPKYNFRISYIFIDLSLACVMVPLFQFTDTLKLSVKKLLKVPPNMVIPVLA